MSCQINLYYEIKKLKFITNGIFFWYRNKIIHMYIHIYIIILYTVVYVQSNLCTFNFVSANYGMENFAHRALCI